MIESWHAAILGAVEGVTEFLPISSTGHLILASRLLGLEGEAANTFDIVIQAGALGAVLVLYRRRMLQLVRGLFGDPAGRRLLLCLFISFLPSAVLGLLFHHTIKTHLFTPRAVLAALAAGGIAMIAIDRIARAVPGRGLDTIGWREAAVIGLAQCFSLWPGTSRAMTTLAAGLLLGLPGPVAAEYSFLLAVPTLGAATAFDALKGGSELMAHSSPAAIAVGFAVTMVVAALAIAGLLRYLARHGLAPFGWYRLALTGVWLLVGWAR